MIYRIFGGVSKKFPDVQFLCHFWKSWRRYLCIFCERLHSLRWLYMDDSSPSLKRCLLLWIAFHGWALLSFGKHDCCRNEEVFPFLLSVSRPVSLTVNVLLIRNILWFFLNKAFFRSLFSFFVNIHFKFFYGNIHRNSFKEFFSEAIIFFSISYIPKIFCSHIAFSVIKFLP